MNDIYEHKAKKYKYKYLKLKNELEGGNMDYGLYGFYSYYGNRLNKRTNNTKFYEKNYVHDLDLLPNVHGDNIVIQHLKSNCTIDDKNNITEYYPGIKSFKFVPYGRIDKNDLYDKDSYGNISEDDYKNIQNSINTTYFTDELDIENLKWTTLNKLKMFRYKGYSKEISETIINSYADKASQLLGNEDIYKADGADELTKIRQKALELRRDRRCNTIHRYPNKPPNIQDLPYTKILLEELIDINEKQLLLSSVLTGVKYGTNPTIYKDPYTLVNEKLGLLSWNMIINKSTLNCIIEYHDVLFPIRIILDMNPETLFYDNILQTNKYSNYMGFFLIRFENDNDKDTLKSRPHNSKEQYYIFFIFKHKRPSLNFSLYTYILTDFRNNIVNWGTVTEKRTVLYHEILQLICMYLNDNVHFYLISNNNNETVKSNNIKSWIHPDDLKYINFENEIHILVSKHNIEYIEEQLKKDPLTKDDKQDSSTEDDNEWTKVAKKITKKKYIQYKDYKLFKCHFGFYDTIENKLCIKLGDMTQEKKDELKQESCINDLNDELYKLDKKRLIQPIALNSIYTDNDIKNFDVDKIMDLRLREIK
jgi:hypothetical protein